MKVKNIAILVVALLVAGAAVVLIKQNSAGDNPTQGGEKKNKSYLIQKKDPSAARKEEAKKVVEEFIARQTAIPNPTGKKGLVFVGRLGGENFDGVYRDDDGKPFPQADQEIMTRLDDAFEKDNVKEIRAVAELAVNSKTAEVRINVVRALGWYGSRTLVEMTPYLSDKNAEVAELSHDEWMAALQEIDDDTAKAATIEMALFALSDKGMLEDVAGELVGIEELPAIQVIADVMDSGGAAVPYVTEAYDDITGEKWAGIDAAEAWLEEYYDGDISHDFNDGNDDILQDEPLAETIQE